jgi:alanine racemase
LQYDIHHIAKIIGASTVGSGEGVVEHLVNDSRKLHAPSTSLFFALQGPRRDGHRFIPELYKKGVRFFVVRYLPEGVFPDSVFLQVNNTLDALQDLAAHHRSAFHIPVIGITGSNGKTIVKEWLYQLLHSEFNIVRSPKSFNSQIGVPLSVWQLDRMHTLGIFEAGISQPGEMQRLERIIQPTIGVLTNIGDAHSGGFSSREQKEKEKRILFRNARLPEPLEITAIERGDRRSVISARMPGTLAVRSIEIPFADEASVKNAITCWEVMNLLGYDHELISRRMSELTAVNMRLEMRKGIQGCFIINDSYSADTSSLNIALGFLQQQSVTPGKTVILSDFMQSALPPEQLYPMVLGSLQKFGVSRLIAIGEQFSAFFKEAFTR